MKNKWSGWHKNPEIGDKLKEHIAPHLKAWGCGCNTTNPAGICQGAICAHKSLGLVDRMRALESDRHCSGMVVFPGTPQSPWQVGIKLGWSSAIRLGIRSVVK